MPLYTTLRAFGVSLRAAGYIGAADFIDKVATELDNQAIVSASECGLLIKALDVYQGSAYYSPQEKEQIEDLRALLSRVDKHDE